VFVYDSEGKAYIEGMAGCGAPRLGYGNEELVEAAARRCASFRSAISSPPEP
jgi:4-aminobutyrate--pyruvate transaminase